MTALSEYIRQLLEQGYNEENITSFLKTQGYDAVTINSSLHQAKKDEKKAHHHSDQQSNLYQQLYTYVYTMLGQGYPAKQIYDTVVEQGYAQKVVKDVFRHINRDYYQGNLDLDEISTKSYKNIMLVVVGVFLIGILVFAGVHFSSFLQEDHSEYTIDNVEISLDSRTVLQGNPLSIIVGIDAEEITGEELVDVSLNLTTEDGRHVTQTKESLTFTKTTQQEMEVPLPDDLKSGTYLVKATMTHNGGVFSDTSRFVVQTKDDNVSEASDETTGSQEEDGVSSNSSQDDANTTVEQDNSSETSQSTEYALESDDVSYSRSDKILFERALESSTKETAINHCTQMDGETPRQECIVAVARTHDDEGVCELSTSKALKEDCYIDLVLDGKQDLCKRVELPENKQFCKELEILTDDSQDNDQKKLG